MQQHLANVLNNSFNSFASPNGDSTNLSDSIINPDETPKTGRPKKRPNKKRSKQDIPDSERVYLNVFDADETVKRVKAWNRVSVKTDVTFTPTTTCIHPPAEKQFYEETEVSVMGYLQGIFATALVQIDELLDERESVPDFKVTVATSDVIADAPGSNTESKPIIKNDFQWHNKVPV